MIPKLLSRLFEVSMTKWTWRWYVIRTRWFGVKIHWIKEVEDEWHNHPWNGFSIVFGSYEEQKKRENLVKCTLIEYDHNTAVTWVDAVYGWRIKVSFPRERVERHGIEPGGDFYYNNTTGEISLNDTTDWKRVWWFNSISAFVPHRTRGNVFTIFFHGPRVNEDWFWGDEKAPWRGPQK